MQASSASATPRPQARAPRATGEPTAALELRDAALELHKALLDAQRVRHERDYGRVESPRGFLELVLHHPSFEWLRALSALIARLDAAIDDGEEGAVPAIEGVMRSLVEPRGRNRAFTAPYWVLVEAVPDVLMAHVRLSRLLGAR